MTVSMSTISSNIITNQFTKKLHNLHKAAATIYAPGNIFLQMSNVSRSSSQTLIESACRIVECYIIIKMTIKSFVKPLEMTKSTLAIDRL